MLTDRRKSVASITQFRRQLLGVLCDTGLAALNGLGRHMSPNTKLGFHSIDCWRGTMFIAIQIAATLIAASRGWGILPFCIFGLVVLQGLKGTYDIETLMIIDYVST